MRRHLPLLIVAGLCAVAIAVATAGCGGADSPVSSTAAEGRALTRQEASLLAGALYRNYRTRGARFQAAALAGPGGGTITMVGDIDWKLHQGQAKVISDAGRDRVTEVAWAPSIALEYRPGMVQAIQKVKPGAKVIARKPDRAHRRLDQIIEVITALATTKRENVQLIMQRPQARFIREDTLRDTEVVLLKYGPRTTLWVNPETGQMLRFESSNKDRTAPIVVDIQPDPKVRVRPPLPEYVVSAQEIADLYAKRAQTSP